MDELFAISITLSAQDVKEDQNNDIVGNISWVFDDAVTDQEQSSNVFKAVAGQKETNSGSFNGITQNWLHFFVQVASIRDSLSFINQSKEFSLNLGVLRILNYGNFFLDLGGQCFHSAHGAFVSFNDCFNLFKGKGSEGAGNKAENEDQSFGHLNSINLYTIIINKFSIYTFEIQVIQFYC